MARRLYINLDEDNPTQALVTSFADDTPLSQPPPWVRGDTRPQQLCFLRRTADVNAQFPFYFVDPSAFAAVKFAGGEFRSTPTGGTFLLTEADTAFPTAAIAYNATAASVQAAVRAIAGTPYDAATVTGDAGGPWLIDRVTLGTNGGFVGDSSSLSPSGSTVVIVTTQEGSTTLSEITQVTLAKAMPILKTSGWSALTAALVTTAVVQAGSATANKTFSLTWNADAYGGAVLLTFLGSVVTSTIGPIPYSANADDVASAFYLHSEVGTSGVSVVRNGPGSFTITCIGATIDLSNTPTLSTSSNTLLVPVGLTAPIAVSTAGADLILGTDDSADIVVEIEIAETSGQINTVAQATTQLLRDLIPNTPGQATGNENYLTANTGVNFSEITDTAGLKAIVTVDFSTEFALYFEHQTYGGVVFVLKAGAETDAAPLIILPNDYNASTNAKYWKLTLSSDTILGNAYVAKTANYTLTIADVTVNCTSGSFTITLPTAVDKTGKLYNIKNSGAGTITVATTSAQTVDGTTPPSVTPGVNLCVQSNGANWIIL